MYSGGGFEVERLRVWGSGVVISPRQITVGRLFGEYAHDMFHVRFLAGLVGSEHET